jgi:hypothetical protein
MRRQIGNKPPGIHFEVVRDLAAAETPLAVKEITALFTDRHENDYDRKISAKWIGWLLRRKLGLRPERVGGAFGVARPRQVLKQAPVPGHAIDVHAGVGRVLAGPRRGDRAHGAGFLPAVSRRGGRGMGGRAPESGDRTRRR